MTDSMKVPVHEVEKRAEMGDADAQVQAALLFELGIEVPENPEKAFYYWRLAAMQGNAWAQENLAKCYERGFGVESNGDEAEKWRGKSRASGFVDEATQSQNAKESAIATDSRKILIVDDDETARMLINKALRESFSIVEAANGREGLKKLGTHPDVGMMIVDVNMPELDGLSMIGHVRRHRDFYLTPVILLTSIREAKSVQLASKLGVKDYIVKPFNAKRLAESVERVYDSHRLRS